MDEYKTHAEILVKEFKQKRAIVLSKRRKSTMNNEEMRIRKEENYKLGLKYLSNNLINALETYKEVFNNLLPQICCDIKIKSKYPNDIDILFIIKYHSIRFISRMANKGEELQEVLIDGMLYVESAYQGSNKEMESQVGLWSDICNDAWGLKSDQDEFVYFFKDILPDIISDLWSSSTLSFVHDK